ncbi:MAG: hypothetical protein IAE88_04640 [Rhodobacteraceae bacterium]|uniref:hypothetical protein n=1 Tax=Accumulibacter sp. TaxID=2053492 RepID=UPI0019DE4F7D|nr:hypothetical protein [Accumulibacter sp.]MBE2258119.1 hypothetical protein [Paracoccaceae bacterium]
MKCSTISWRHLAISILVLLAGGACTTPDGQPQGAKADDGKEQRRQALRQLRDDTLTELIARKPELKDEIASAVGYGVFASKQYDLALPVTGEGGGILTDNRTGQTTYMQMARVGSGPDIGFKSFRQLIVFNNRDLFDAFRAVGADVSVAGEAADKPGAGKGLVVDGNSALNPMLSTYQLTDKGVVLQANWGGVAYLPDAELER